MFPSLLLHISFAERDLAFPFLFFFYIIIIILPDSLLSSRPFLCTCFIAQLPPPFLSALPSFAQLRLRLFVVPLHFPCSSISKLHNCKLYFAAAHPLTSILPVRRIRFILLLSPLAILLPRSLFPPSSLLSSPIYPSPPPLAPLLIPPRHPQDVFTR